MKIHSPARLARTPRPLRKGAGFSLAEMMVVIVIIGLLVTMVVPNVMRNLTKSNVTIAKTDIVQINQALQAYAQNNGMNYPDSLDELLEPDADGYKFLDYEEIPLDPWNMPYMYDPPTSGNDYRIYTYGKDGVPGGEGENSDMDQKSIKQR